MARTRNFESVEADRIFLREDNPRHEPLESQEEIIEYLCKDEQVYNLARHIARNGTNPLDLFGIIELPNSGKKRTKKTYYVGEGNRRMCAIKLLIDPDLAPPHQRKDFEKQSAIAEPIDSVQAVVFNNQDDLDLWMEVIHGGAQGGIGRKSWNPEQKTRFTGEKKNKVAQAVLDYAESEGIISTADRKGKLTTVQRYLSNAIVTEALGLDKSNLDDISRNRPKEDFDKLLGVFINDLISGEVNSRANKDKIDPYGRALSTTKETSGDRIEPESLKEGARPRKRKAKRRRPPISRIEFDESLSQALEVMGNEKLRSLYYSICDINVRQHTPLIAVGVWAFIESLSALAGRNSSTDFTSYLSQTRFITHGLGDRRKYGPVKDALSRISRNGNATKHHEISASFDGAQLANDVATITPLLIKTAEDGKSKK